MCSHRVADSLPIDISFSNMNQECVCVCVCGPEAPCRFPSVCMEKFCSEKSLLGFGQSATPS
jgi:hypothetical protein